MILWQCLPMQMTAEPLLSYGESEKARRERETEGKSENCLMTSFKRREGEERKWAGDVQEESSHFKTSPWNSYLQPGTPAHRLPWVLPFRCAASGDEFEALTQKSLDSEDFWVLWGCPPGGRWSVGPQFWVPVMPMNGQCSLRCVEVAGLCVWSIGCQSGASKVHTSKTNNAKKMQPTNHFQYLTDIHEWLVW